MSARLQTGPAPAPGEPAQGAQGLTFPQPGRSGAGTIADPASRARRLEFQGGVTRISFDQITQTQAFSLNTGQLLLDDNRTDAVASPLTLGTSSGALVYDTSSFGATSPVAGQRYRLEAAPTF